jgi:hypothetical protein
MAVEASFERFAGFFAMRLLSGDRNKHYKTCVTITTAATRLPSRGLRRQKFNSRRVAPTRLDVMRFNDDGTDVPLAVTTNRPLSRNLI